MAFFKKSHAADAARAAATHMTSYVGGQLYGVPIDRVSEVAALSRLAPISGEDPAVIGECALDGSAIVVIDMGVRLHGEPIVPTAKSCLLIVRRERARSGCLMDAPAGMVHIPAEAIEYSGCLIEAAGGVVALARSRVRSPESTSASGAIYGLSLYKTERETILLPDPEAFYPI